MTLVFSQLNNAFSVMKSLNTSSTSPNIFSVNTSYDFNSSIFGSFGNLNFNQNVFGMFGPMNFNFPTTPVQFPSFNFNFQAPVQQFPSFNFNFNTFGTNVRSPRYTKTTSTSQSAVSKALSQVGQRENGSSNDSTAVRAYKNGRVDNNPWCASFVSWCYGSAQGSNNAKTFGYTASSQEIRRKADQAGFYSKKGTGYQPQVGDIAVWKSADGSKGHVGIVVALNDDGSFETVEGNTSNKVCRKTRTVNTNLSSGNFDGFVRMNEWTAAVA